jgi:hypothetical protein
LVEFNEPMDVPKTRDGVWRKPNPKMQGDVQEPDLRCGTSGTSGHVTTKSSIRIGVCFINPAFMHQKLRVLPWEISRTALERRVRGKLAEGRAIDPDRMREVSRRHSRRIETGI